MKFRDRRVSVKWPLKPIGTMFRSPAAEQVQSLWLGWESLTESNLFKVNEMSKKLAWEFSTVSPTFG